MQRKQAAEKEIFLDSGSTCGLFKDPELVQGIRKADVKAELETNGGYKSISQQADTPGYGDVYFAKDAMANICSVSEMARKYRVTLNSQKENAFLIHMEDGRIIKFPCNDKGLYTRGASNKNWLAGSEQVFGLKDKLRKGAKPEEKKKVSAKSKRRSKSKITRGDRVEGFTRRKVLRARRTRRLYHILGAPSIGELKKCIRQNVIKNYPVVVEDINLAEMIFGRDVATLKGKTARPRPKHVVFELMLV